PGGRSRALPSASRQHLSARGPPGRDDLSDPGDGRHGRVGQPRLQRNDHRHPAMTGPVLATRPDLDNGSVLPDLRKPAITKVQLVKYAGASGDYNLIHTDDETARTVGLDGVIAHGMLSMAFLGEYLCWLAGPESVRRLS